MRKPCHNILQVTIGQGVAPVSLPRHGLHEELLEWLRRQKRRLDVNFRSHGKRPLLPSKLQLNIEGLSENKICIVSHLAASTTPSLSSFKRLTALLLIDW